ncbi:MAG: hypothetical protein ACK5Q5_03045 [Planctomycetaceae bacterium]
MGDDLRYRPSRSVAPLMAAAFVLLMGTAFCVALLMAFDGGSPIPVAIAVGSAVGFGLLMWLLRDRPEAGKRNWFAWVNRRGQDAEQAMYRVAVIRHKHSLGDKRPPTLDELRELKDPTRTWVPRRDRGRDAGDSRGE